MNTTLYMTLMSRLSNAQFYVGDAYMCNDEINFIKYILIQYSDKLDIDVSYSELDDLYDKFKEF